MNLNFNRLLIVLHYGKDSYSFLNVLKKRKMIDNEKLGILKDNLYFGGFSNDTKQKYKDKIVLDIIGNNTWAFLPNNIKIEIDSEYKEYTIEQDGIYFRSGDESVIEGRKILFDSFFFQEFFNRTDGGCYIYNNGIRDLVRCPYKYLDRLPDKVVFNLGQYQLIIKKSQYFFDDQFIFDINKSNLFPPISLPFSLFNEFATELDIENKKMILYFNQKDFFHTDFLLKGKYRDKKTFLICLTLVLIILLCSIGLYKNKNKCKVKRTQNREKVQELIETNFK